jgi:hypothetical protein
MGFNEARVEPHESGSAVLAAVSPELLNVMKHGLGSHHTATA